ncbi:ABC transporter permease [Lederbergia citrea]|uniref:ABC transporter permease n=1 Tax=Lederbergia citrea TaxID=2833581 RepID=A0A942Z734_9BACI|nr:ABC transporter permease [Lederbergia citrea]MBS4179173.1 ABC transporter permease [Lederbergia citrea]MBS4205836.1 ABC transporter permease [Lederbergia citrea]MBS4224716.1 ABC transporter permease [Lederbergia citrea]
MRRASAIAIFELKRMFQKPQSYILMFGMPILFTLIFGGLFSSETEVKPSIAVVDQDNSRISQMLINDLNSKKIMNMTFENAKNASAKFADQKITGYIRINESFEEQVLMKENPEILFVHSPSFNGSKMIEQGINDSMIKLKIGATASSVYEDITGDNWNRVQEKISKELVVNSAGVETVTVTKSKDLATMNNMTARSAGFTIMFVMITMLISTGVLLEARQTGVWYRMMSTSTSKKELLTGYLLAFFLMGWIQFGVLMIISKFVFHVNWGNLLGSIVLVSSLLLCTIGLGLFIAGFVKTSEQQSVFGNLIIISTCMLGGVYWPLEIMPGFMQQIAKFVPQYWGLEGFTELSVRGGTLVDIFVPSGVLLAFTLVFLIVGMTRIRFE